MMKRTMALLVRVSDSLIPFSIVTISVQITALPRRAF